MRKFTVAVVAAIVAALSIATAVKKASAAALPSDAIRCYYHLYYCSYPGTAYWSDCSPQYPEGFVRTDIAISMCRVYHEGTAW